ncbi:hypothetical protein IscW_ISCW000144, partial [Ixodes scapularis]
MLICRPDDTGPLFITKVVREKGTDVAKKLSKVTLPRDFSVFEAYSGYITVDETYDSNMFFFLVKGKVTTHDVTHICRCCKNLRRIININAFGKHKTISQIKAPKVPPDIPVHLPHSFQSKKKISYKRIIFWLTELTVTCSLVHVHRDVTVERDAGIQAPQISLVRFSLFILFSFAGRLAVGFAHYVSENENRPSGDVATGFNLKGVIAGSPFLGPLLETIDSSEFLFSVGMLNTTSKVLFHQAFENLTKETNRTIQLFTFFKTVFQDYTKKNPTLSETNG